MPDSIVWFINGLIWFVLPLVVGLLFLLILFRTIIAPAMRRRRVRGRYRICTPYLLPVQPERRNRIIKVSSKVQKYREYEVNLHAMTCTCRRFRRKRRFYPEQDIHRLCRHQRRALEENNALDHYTELDQCIIRDRIRDKCYHRFEVKGMEFGAGFHPRVDFIRIFARTPEPEDPPEGPFTGPFKKYVYSIHQEHWVYGEVPLLAETVIIPKVTEYYREVRQIYVQEKLKEEARFHWLLRLIPG